MPLRSVEAATRDDAIAAAREQFGPSARVVGVRRVRSGGVLGFFATERYVAEVAPDLTNRPAVPAVTAAALPDDAPADFSSPLASAAPARARAAAPARNGAAAWAAEAARTAESSGATRSSSTSSSPSSARAAGQAARTSAPSWQPAPVHPAAVGPAKRPAPADDDRVSELASLLAAKAPESDTPAYARAAFPPASFAWTEREGTTSDRDRTAVPAGRDADKRVIPADVPDVPSPFTAALARMVAGDRDVRQAVEEALVRPGAARAGAAEPRPIRPARVTESAVPSSPARQEEETVGDPVIAPSTSMTRTVEVPPWAAEPEVATPSVSSREEAIAEVLRSALAQGHSDEALAGILRKVLAGASPQTALTGPDAEPVVATLPPQVVVEDSPLHDLTASPAPTLAVAEVPAVAEAESVVSRIVGVETAVAEPVERAVVAQEPVVAEDVARGSFAAHPLDEYAFPESSTPAWESPAPRSEVPAVEVPFVERVEVPFVERVAAPVSVFPVREAPVTGATMFEVPVFETRAGAPAPRPTGPFAPAAPTWAPAPAWVAAPAASMWGPPSMSATLWGDPVAPAATTAAPIWGEISSPESQAETAAPVEASLFELVEAPAEQTAEDTAADDSAADDIAAEATAVEAIAEPVAEEIRADEEAGTDEAADAVAEEVVEELVEAAVEELAPVLARTASDPAPMMSFDSTSIMPPLSLLPPLPGSRGRGRPPVPPAPSRRSVSSSAAATPPAPAAPGTGASAAAPADDVWAPIPAPAQSSTSESLATVTRLPVAPLMATPETPKITGHVSEAAAPTTEAVAAPVAAPVLAEPVSPAAIATGEVADRLVELGVPRGLLGATFADDVAERGTYAALTRALALRLPKAPDLPDGAGEVLFVVGPGVETLRAAQTLAASLRLDPDRVQWATRGDLAGLAPESSRVTTVGAAINRREDAAVAGTVTIVAVDAPMRADAYWTAQMMAIWTPVAVWAVVEATRKPEDLEPWIDGLPQVDALIVQDTDLSADPAAVLRRVDAPVALLDGARATPHRWASLLCERLENPQP